MLDTRGASHYGHGDSLEEASRAPAKDAIHTLITSNGAPYMNYQTRILMGTYELIRQMPGGEKHVGLTRILHRSKPDILMNAIETFHATPLQPECDGWCEYPVSDRANAVRQFFDAAEKNKSMIRADWIYMAETDYVFMKPLALPRELKPGYDGWAYPFNYINAQANKRFMERLLPGVDVALIPNSGPAPVLMRRTDWVKVVPFWEDLTAKMEEDKEMTKSLGWVREMYDFSLALVAAGLKLELDTEKTSPFIAHLPGVSKMGEAHAFHYTLCTIYKTINGSDVWAFDKRFYAEARHPIDMPKVPPMPEFEAGKYRFIEGPPVTKEKHELIKQMTDQINRAIDTLSPLPQAWIDAVEA